MDHSVGRNLTDYLVGLVLLILDDVEDHVGLGIDDGQGLLDAGHSFLQRRGVLEHVSIQTRLVHEGPQDASLVLLLAEAGQETFEGNQLLENGQQAPTGDVALRVLDVDLHFLDRQIRQVLVEGCFVLEVALRLAFLHFEERRLRDVHIPVLDELLHLPEEKRQQQRPDVAPVHVGIGHHDDLVVPGAANIEGFLVVLPFLGILTLAPDAGPEGHDQHPDLLVREHLVEPRLLHVENLALERQNRLKLPVAALFG